MSNLQTWSTLVGLVMPVIVALLNQPQWKPWVKSAVAIAASVVAAGVTCELSGQLSVSDLAGSAITIATASIATFHLFWKPTGAAPAIEASTKLTRAKTAS